MSRLRLPDVRRVAPEILPAELRRQAAPPTDVARAAERSVAVLLGRRQFPEGAGRRSRCRMGNDPATSVTRRDGRFHEVDNLYACDGSVFPTSSGYNPTLTIIAVALKIAHGIAGTPPSV